MTEKATTFPSSQYNKCQLPYVSGKLDRSGISSEYLMGELMRGEVQRKRLKDGREIELEVGESPWIRVWYLT